MATQTFRSKIGIGYWALVGWLTIQLVVRPATRVVSGEPVSPTSFVIAAVLLGGLAWLAWVTRYDVTDEAVVIHGGIVRGRVPIDSISRLRATGTLLAAPALSLDRIEILSSRGPYAVISPADKAGFVAAVRARNPKVELEGLG